MVFIILLGRYIFITSLHKFSMALCILSSHLMWKHCSRDKDLVKSLPPMNNINIGDWRRSDPGRSDNRWGHQRSRGHWGPIRGQYSGQWPIRGQYCITAALARTNCFSDPGPVINRYSKHKQWQQFLWNILGKWNNVARLPGKNKGRSLLVHSVSLLWIFSTALHWYNKNRLDWDNPLRYVDTLKILCKIIFWNLIKMVSNWKHWITWKH